MRGPTGVYIFGICPQIQNKPKQITHTLWSSFFIYKRTIPHRILNHCGPKMSKFIVVHLGHSETMTFMSGIPFSIKFIAVVFEVGTRG